MSNFHKLCGKIPLQRSRRPSGYVFVPCSEGQRVSLEWHNIGEDKSVVA